LEAWSAASPSFKAALGKSLKKGYLVQTDVIMPTSTAMLKKHPFYFKSTVILFGLVLFVYILFNLGDVLVPLAFALLLAILLNPLTILLEKWRVPKVVAIIIAILLGILLIAGVAWLLYMEVSSFSDQLPVFKKRLIEMAASTQRYASQHLGVSYKKQDLYISQAETGLKPLLASTVGTVMGTLSMIVLLPVYTFLFLYYKKLIINFLYELFAEENAQDLSKVLTQTKGAVQSYMFGLLLEAIIVATLNSVALLIIGVDYAILLGVLGALLNVLPFIGGIIAVLLPVLIATVTKQGIHTQVEVIIAYFVIQMIDNHFLVPYIVSSKVKINALISIIIVLLGGALWGISGMFLSIPFVGVLKIIFDRIPDLKPWGKLLGTEVPTTQRGLKKLISPVKQKLQRKKSTETG
jgi:predicted PurR-regulated permease PerM